MFDKIFITKRGLKLLDEKIHSLKSDLMELLKHKRDAYYDQGNTWHDNFAFEQLSMQEIGLGKLIEDFCNTRLKTEVVGDNSLHNGRVFIGNTITLKSKDGKSIDYTVSGYMESDVNHSPKKLEYLSPVIINFFDKKIGHREKVRIHGDFIEFELVKII